jgi:hypothetical protein
VLGGSRREIAEEVQPGLANRHDTPIGRESPQLVLQRGRAVGSFVRVDADTRPNSRETPAECYSPAARRQIRTDGDHLPDADGTGPLNNQRKVIGEGSRIKMHVGINSQNNSA